MGLPLRAKEQNLRLNIVLRLAMMKPGETRKSSSANGAINHLKVLSLSKSVAFAPENVMRKVANPKWFLRFALFAIMLLKCPNLLKIDIRFVVGSVEPKIAIDKLSLVSVAERNLYLMNLDGSVNTVLKNVIDPHWLNPVGIVA